VPGAEASIFPTLLESAGGCHNFACLWFSQGCQPGCASCSDRVQSAVLPTDVHDTCSEPGATMAPTLDERLRTYANSTAGDWTRWNPWRAPGAAPVASPCGVAGGGGTPGGWMSDSLTEHFRAGAATPPFVRRGFDGRDVPEGPKTKWAPTAHTVPALTALVPSSHCGVWLYHLSLCGVWL
jgi:hypothetical protein